MIAVAAALLAAAVLPAQSNTIAFLGTLNAGGDPRFDYLSSFISGIVLYDMTSQAGVTLVDRSSLDDVLHEQEVSLSLGKGDAVKIGKVLGARWISKAEFTIVGGDIALTLHLIDAESSQAFVYADRGKDENLIHGLVELAVKKATGKDVPLRTDITERSLTSLRDEKPGSINLHCRLIDAEIHLDGKFIGYTTGDIRKPFVIQDLEPGKHEVAVYLRGFGRVILPEVSFVPWKETITVRAGKNEVVKSNAGSFTEWWYDLIRLKDERWKLLDEPGKNAKSGEIAFEFMDRKGKTVKVKIAYAATRDAKGGSITATASYGAETAQYVLPCAIGEEAESTIKIGPLSLRGDINLKGTNDSYELEIQRTDVEWGEWEKK